MARCCTPDSPESGVAMVMSGITIAVAAEHVRIGVETVRFYDKPEEETMKTTDLKIEGMNCEACAAGARQALRSVSGVRSVHVELSPGRASVERTRDVPDRDLVSAIVDAGFDAEVQDMTAFR